MILRIYCIDIFFGALILPSPLAILIRKFVQFLQPIATICITTGSILTFRDELKALYCSIQNFLRCNILVWGFSRSMKKNIAPFFAHVYIKAISNQICLQYVTAITLSDKSLLVEG